MELKQAEEMTKSLMRTYGVYDYKFQWMARRNKFSRAGQCNYKKRTIELQPTFVELNYPFFIKGTILHEIAHAIMGQKHGHNKFWKRCAISLGDNGARCYGKNVKRIKN